MREILFRGQDIYGRWFEGGYYENNTCKYIVTPDFVRHLVDPETVGQYTEFVDKNGVKIFEGDIIRSTETGETAIVQWFPEHSAFLIWCKTSNQVGFLYECEKSIIEVIGNIHDNPELL